ncbi:uncharacterized protein LOC111115148 isoform X2 [Crassostrea virginica]
MNNIGMALKVKHCFQCEGYTGYYCHKCEKDLCFSCKLDHIASFETRSHYVTLYREKFYTLLKQERCVKDEDTSYDKFCTRCDIPVCFHCRKHRTHNQTNIRTEYKNKRNENKDIFIKIRGEFLLNARALSFSIKSDVETEIHRCHEAFSNFPVKIATKKQKLEYFFENAQMQKEIRDGIAIILKQKLLEQKAKQTSSMIKHIKRLQQCDINAAELVSRPVKFLRFVQSKEFLEIINRPYVAKQTFPFFTQDRNIENLIEFLLNIKTGKMRRRKEKKEHVLGICYPKLDYGITTYDLDSVCHISCVRQGLVWVSDERKLIIVNSDGQCLGQVLNAFCSRSGTHTLNTKSELIYIAEDLNINRLVYIEKGECDMLIQRYDCGWEPLSLFCSKESGDILVAMISRTLEACKLVIYTEKGICISQFESKDYKRPIFITENTNKDVVVSDEGYSAVVVSNREGRHRFSYKGHRPESRLDPRGICTDPLSNILVCTSGTVQMIDKDGQFLVDIFREPFLFEFIPISLCYEVDRNVVWIGSRENKTILGYRHIDRKPALVDYCEPAESIYTSPTYAEIDEWYDQQHSAVMYSTALLR